MKKSVIIVLIIVLVACLSVFAVHAATAAGGVDDPFVSLSYLKSTVADKLLSQVKTKESESLDRVGNDAYDKLDDVAVPKAGFSYAPKFTSLNFNDSGKITLDQFGCFILLEGIGRLFITSGEVINISTGETCKSGDILTPNHKYFAAEGSSAYIRMYTSDSWGMADGYYKTESGGEIPLRESFLDVGEDHWAADYIFKLAQFGIVHGVGDHKFEPSATVTRGTFVTILGRMCKVDISEYKSTSFTDTDISMWYGPYVAWAAGNGLVLGDSGIFNPDNVITREQLAVVIIRFVDFMKMKYTVGNSNIQPYTDSDKISSWAADAVVKARDMGIMTGKENNTFDPNGTATRAEICAVTVRLMELSGLLK